MTDLDTPDQLKVFELPKASNANVKRGDHFPRVAGPSHVDYAE